MKADTITVARYGWYVAVAAAIAWAVPAPVISLLRRSATPDVGLLALGAVTVFVVFSASNALGAYRLRVGNGTIEVRRWWRRSTSRVLSDVLRTVSRQQAAGGWAVVAELSGGREEVVVERVGRKVAMRTSAWANVRLATASTAAPADSTAGRA